MIRPAGSRPAMLALLGMAIAIGPLSAQEGSRQAAPLTKSDLVRLLSGGTYTRDEVISIIERSCLEFDPSAQDRTDLERLGADAAVFAAIDDCVSVPSVPVQVTVSSARLATRVGGAVDLSVSARRGEAPAAGVPLVLIGSDLIAGGPTGPLVATTGPDGQASFRIPAGTRAGTINLQLGSGSARVTGTTSVQVAVAPGPPVRVQVQPGEVRVPADGGTAEVRATAFDRFGNRVPRAVLRFEAHAVDPAFNDAPSPFLPRTRTADQNGVVAIDLALDPETPTHRIEVQSEGVTLASVEIQASPVVAAGPEPEAATAEPRPPAAGEPGVDAQTETPDSIQADRSVAGREGQTPSDLEDRRERARAAFAAGDTETAVALYQGLVSLEPDDADAWFELGRAWAAEGDPTEARRALTRARELDPTLDDGVRRELAGLRPLTPWATFDVWGGTSVQSDESSGVVLVEATVYPVPILALWGRYDDALGLHNPAFVRRTQDLRSYFGGAAIEWGQDRRLRTAFEVGRREHTADLFQNVFHAEQAVRLDRGLGEVAFGGYFGRWFDRDDWIGYARGDFGVAAPLSIRPSIYVGETLTTLPDTSRIVENEVRGYLGIAIRPVSRVEITPTFGIGSVSNDSGRLATGSLIDAYLRLSAILGPSSRFQVFVRHHRPPDGESFSSIAAGLVLGVER